MEPKILNEEQVRYWIRRLKDSIGGSAAGASQALSILEQADAAARTAVRPDDVPLHAVDAAVAALNQAFAGDAQLLEGIQKLHTSINERASVLHDNAAAPSREEMERENDRRANIRSKVEDLAKTTDDEEFRKVLLEGLRRHKFD
jgi:hypothetical protein